MKQIKWCACFSVGINRGLNLTMGEKLSQSDKVGDFMTFHYFMLFMSIYYIKLFVSKGEGVDGV